MIKLDDGIYKLDNGKIVLEKFVDTYRRYIGIAPGSWTLDYDLEIWDYVFEEEYEKLRC